MRKLGLLFVAVLSFTISRAQYTVISDDSAYVRDYTYSIVLNNIPYTFEMPLAPQTYKVNVEISYPVMVWRKNGNSYKRIFLKNMTI